MTFFALPITSLLFLAYALSLWIHIYHTDVTKNKKDARLSGILAITNLSIFVISTIIFNGRLFLETIILIVDLFS